MLMWCKFDIFLLSSTKPLSNCKLYSSHTSLQSDSFIELEKFGLYGGIKNFSCRGLLWVQLEQLEKQYPPFVGTVTLSFYQDPEIDYDFTELAVILDVDAVRYETVPYLNHRN